MSDSVNIALLLQYNISMCPSVLASMCCFSFSITVLKLLALVLCFVLSFLLVWYYHFSVYPGTGGKFYSDSSTNYSHFFFSLPKCFLSIFCFGHLWIGLLQLFWTQSNYELEYPFSTLFSSCSCLLSKVVFLLRSYFNQTVLDWILNILLLLRSRWLLFN